MDRDSVLITHFFITFCLNYSNPIELIWSWQPLETSTTCCLYSRNDNKPKKHSYCISTFNKNIKSIYKSLFLSLTAYAHTSKKSLKHLNICLINMQFHSKDLSFENTQLTLPEMEVSTTKCNQR